MRKKLKNKQGTIKERKLTISKQTVDGIQVNKQAGSTTDVKLHTSNLQNIELNTEDQKRLKQINAKCYSRPRTAIGVSFTWRQANA